MRLIADGVVEREGVTGLASSLGYSERHLNRVLTDEVGAGPLAIARAQRAQIARQLIETTEMTLTDIAFAAGFGSVRQFNDTVREVFASTPTDLRQNARRRPRRGSAVAPRAGRVTLRLPTRAPFDGAAVIDFLARRAIAGIERVTESDVDGADGSTTVYERSMSLAHGHGLVALTAPGGRNEIHASIALDEWEDLAAAVQRIRRLLDLDADPVAVDSQLAADPTLAPLVTLRPGRRSPGTIDPFETLVRAIIGQQISVAGARTVAARLVEAVGDRLPNDDGTSVSHVFPTPAAVAGASDDAFSMPTARRDTIRRAALAVASGEVGLDPGVDPNDARRQLLDLKGIGPWTADYVLMRGLSHPDVFLGSDLGVVNALRALGVDRVEPERAATWAPWRSYATHLLWASLEPTTTTTAPSPRREEES